MAANLDDSYPKAVAAFFKETQRGRIRKRDFTVILSFIALVEEWDKEEREYIASLTKDNKRNLYGLAEMVRMFMATRKRLLGK
jgi:phenylacetate-coenzyme A ligase PaaK-like adenylate-forming protein